MGSCWGTVAEFDTGIAKKPWKHACNLAEASPIPYQPEATHSAINVHDATQPTPIRTQMSKYAGCRKRQLMQLILAPKDDVQNLGVPGEMPVNLNPLVPQALLTHHQAFTGPAVLPKRGWRLKAGKPPSQAAL
jgi:hypothetical protein